eukprot:COSAG06_NODE_1883_length_8145_cov_21.194009_5_plen_56_part_00
MGVLCCAVLCCAVLCCAVLCCAVTGAALGTVPADHLGAGSQTAGGGWRPARGELA